ncbi:hypothetical protein GBAR_LOCUS8659 [Geodia barretti]|uniref:Uncharacterized protein n=1 Tax=Geodia barretti TaxID=519541 RepID=A0AA35RLE4_GEOBA|nr:hypothetical protein GBAR_LOCUS8659 [Geodia barretti]
MWALYLCVISLFAPSRGAPEGTILSLGIFNGNLQVQQYPVPATSGGPVQKNHPLSGDLAKFSLTCSPSCEGPNVLSFERGPVILHVVLNDGTLSLMETDVSHSVYSKPTEVVELDSKCTPLHLMPFRYSQDQFAVVCTAFDVHFAEISTDHSIKLHPLIVGSERPGVLVESNRQLFSVSYLGQNAYEKYSYHSATPEILSLPSNVLCLEGYSATYPLHGQEMFLLQCVTDDGPTLYIVPLDQDEMARAVPSQGRPYSSLDGTYISMVNGSRVVSFPAANQSVLSSTETFTSRVKKFEFLNSRVAIVLTQGGGHYVMYLSHGVSEITQLPGGVPVKWVWIDPHNYYLYVTDQNELFLFNDTLKDPEDMPKSVVSRPELLLFARKYVPGPGPTSTNNSGLSDKDPSGPNSLPAILGGVFGGTILTAVAAVAVLMLLVYMKKLPCSRHTYSPVEETNPQGTAMTTLKPTVEEGSKGKGGDQYEISFSQPADEPHAAENWSDSAGNVATATHDPQEPQKKKGKLLLFRVFAGQLITGVYPLPPSEPREFTQSLAGPLAGVSLRCGSCPHDAVTRLSFQTESLRTLVILSDRVLSVVTINESVTPEVVQVVSLDEQCTPQTLVAFADSKQFAVICARLSLQFGSVDGTRGRVKLQALETYPNPIPESSKSVFITTGVEIKIVTIGGNFVEVYTVNDGSPVTDELPRNVNCLNTSEPILTPLHTEPAVLLQCNTTNGMVVYVIPIPIVRGADARGFPADGLVLSSQDGTYVIVVKGPVLTSQENGAPGKQVVLRSQITAVDNLDSDNVRVLTKEKRHIVINLESCSQRVMPGGHPVLSEWVGTSNDYIYSQKTTYCSCQ